jgi:2-amino-4-hydroxy-6-hydroxymethyldihydropteridine diphosphokinase
MGLVAPVAYCLISLGANLADRNAALDQAVRLLAADPALHVVARSGWRETQAVGGPPGQPAFLNGAVLLETSLAPEELLATLFRIEDLLGRVRHERWGPRTLDLDLLLYDQSVLESPRLVLPHPRMAFRRFVLAPAAEIAPDMLHPTLGWTIRQLHDHLVQAAPYVALAGPPGAGKTDVAEQSARGMGARLLRDPSAPGARDVGSLNVVPHGALHIDPAGRGWQAEIELLDRRRRLLERSQLEHSTRPAPRGAESNEAAGASWTVSDFWFDQSWAHASIGLDEPRRTEFQRRWQQGRASVVPPKLLVVLDEAPQAPAAPVAPPARRGEQASGGRRLAELHDALMELAARPGLGPVLRLSGLATQAAANEVIAAMRAME